MGEILTNIDNAPFNYNSEVKGTELPPQAFAENHEFSNPENQKSIFMALENKLSE